MVPDKDVMHGKPDRHEKDHASENVLEFFVCIVDRDDYLCTVDISVWADLFSESLVSGCRESACF